MTEFWNELMTRASWEKLQDLSKEFDFILIDTPPVMPVTDSCVIGAMADGVILVIQAGRTQRDIVRHAEKRLAQVGAKTQPARSRPWLARVARTRASRSPISARRRGSRAI